MAQKTVRIISAAQDAATPPPGHRKVNIATDSLVADIHHSVPTHTQATGAALRNEYPTFVESTHGVAAALPKNGLPIIFIPGYTGPQ